MKLTIEIDMGNEAFAEGNAGYESARILKRLADDLASGWVGANEFKITLRDINGNTVGKLTASNA